MHSPRLLFLAYYFPPLRAIASKRTYSIAKWLTRNGWQVTVVTPRESVWRRTEAEEDVRRFLQAEGIRCLRTGHEWPSLCPWVLKSGTGLPARVASWLLRRSARMMGVDGEIGWAGEAIRACAGLQPEDVDVILASGPPFIAFRIARRLAARLNRPFVLDYRDPWTSAAYSNKGPRPAVVAEERAILRLCRAAIVVSPTMAAVLRAQSGVDGKIEVLTNGYDPEELARIAPRAFDHFAIVYSGAFYPPWRSISPLFAALRRLATSRSETGRDWRVHYYGQSGAHVRDEAARYGLQDRVLIHGTVAHGESLSAVGGASVALVVASLVPDGGLRERSILPGKVFETIGLGTPILGIAPRGSDLENLLETSGLGRAFPASDEVGIANFLEELIAGRKMRLRDHESYAWPNLGRTLDGILRAALPAERDRPTAGNRR
jgi:glycosyltransferase involved in cell wall biosynthesis